MAWLGRGLTMPYHAYAPLAPLARDPDTSPSRVSSVTFCVQSEIYAAARRMRGAGGGRDAGRAGETVDCRTRGRLHRACCLAGILFYFICINHVACDAIEKYICLLGNFALAFPCCKFASAPSRPCSLLPEQGGCKDMAWHAAGPVVAVVAVVLASAYVSLELLM